MEYLVIILLIVIILLVMVLYRAVIYIRKLIEQVIKQQGTIDYLHSSRSEVFKRMVELERHLTSALKGKSK